MDLTKTLSPAPGAPLSPTVGNNIGDKTLERFHTKFPRFVQPVIGDIAFPPSLIELEKNGSVVDSMLRYTSYDTWVLEEIGSSEVRLKHLEILRDQIEAAIFKNTTNLPASASSKRIVGVYMQEQEYQVVSKRIKQEEANLAKLFKLHQALEKSIDAVGRIMAYKTAEMRMTRG